MLNSVTERGNFLMLKIDEVKINMFSSSFVKLVTLRCYPREKSVFINKGCYIEVLLYYTKWPFMRIIARHFVVHI